MLFRSKVIERYLRVRQFTEELCKPLCTEDYVIQSMPDVSPPKWHLGHTTWFFEKMVLEQSWETSAKKYIPYHPQYDFLFNSYYESIGPRIQRDRRGTLSRPTVEEIYQYRQEIDERLCHFLNTPKRQSKGENSDILKLIEIGIHHEQQHQELLLMDIKHIFWTNPLRPVYRPGTTDRPLSSVRPWPKWIAYPSGVVEVGTSSDSFAFDNERPRHKVYLNSYSLGTNLVTQGEFQEFIEDRGYLKPELWLSEGWRVARQHSWESPLYWEKIGSAWWQMTLAGMKPVRESEPVCHVSFYEADAFARWKGCRLPREEEWENAATLLTPSSNENPDPRQLFGEVWEWTQSPYSPYPGFHSWNGKIAEYNAKFMCNQMVLRGGSCMTPAEHIRPTYRNYFTPESRWQFSGIRLATDEGVT